MASGKERDLLNDPCCAVYVGSSMYPTFQAPEIVLY